MKDLIFQLEHNGLLPAEQGDELQSLAVDIYPLSIPVSAYLSLGVHPELKQRILRK